MKWAWSDPCLGEIGSASLCRRFGERTIIAALMAPDYDLSPIGETLPLVRREEN